MMIKHLDKENGTQPSNPMKSLQGLALKCATNGYKLIYHMNWIIQQWFNAPPQSLSLTFTIVDPKGKNNK